MAGSKAPPDLEDSSVLVLSLLTSFDALWEDNPSSRASRVGAHRASQWVVCAEHSWSCPCFAKVFTRTSILIITTIKHMFDFNNV